MRVHVQVEEVVEGPVDYLGDDQYFIMYCLHEGEYFNPEQIFGAWGAEMASHIVSRYRQTGILLKPSGPQFRSPWQHLSPRYAVIEGAVAVYVLKPTDVLYKLTKMQDMTKAEADAYASQQQEVRKNITKFIEDPE